LAEVEVEKVGREVGDIAVLDIFGGDMSLEEMGCWVLEKLWSCGAVELWKQVL
jgi:hypothetical protein